jgi:cyclohexa-1,5-dienecarbonyl-CoA hydratase
MSEIAPRALSSQVLSLDLGHGVGLEAVAQLRQSLNTEARRPGVKAVLLKTSGSTDAEPAASPSASLLSALHGLFLDQLELEVLIVASVRGRCLGSTLGAVLPASFITASYDTTFGAPEVGQGAFAPIASVLLPEKIARVHAERMLITGEPIDAETAQRLGLVDRLDADPVRAAEELIARHILPKSDAALRLAVRAAREPLRDRVLDALERLETIYLDELLSSRRGPRVATVTSIARRPARW